MQFIQPCCVNMYGWIENGTMTLWKKTDGTEQDCRHGGLAGCRGPTGMQINYCPSCGRPIKIIHSDSPDIELERENALIRERKEAREWRCPMK